MEMSSVWQGTFDNIDYALEIINDVGWNIKHLQNHKLWQLFSGDQLIASFDNQTEMEAFILGMALALGSLHPEIIEQIKKFIG
jgi:hypothetical protein